MTTTSFTASDARKLLKRIEEIRRGRDKLFRISERTLAEWEKKARETIKRREI